MKALAKKEEEPERDEAIRSLLSFFKSTNLCLCNCLYETLRKEDSRNEADERREKKREKNGRRNRIWAGGDD
jgi:hypothetical protein